MGSQAARWPRKEASTSPWTLALTNPAIALSPGPHEFERRNAQTTYTLSFTPTTISNARFASPRFFTAATVIFSLPLFSYTL